MGKVKKQPAPPGADAPAVVSDRRTLVADDMAYIIPMAVFLAFTFAGGQWPSLYPAFYVARAIIVAVLLVMFWRQFTRISWRYWWLGVIVGVVGIFQWVPMQLFLQSHFEFFAPGKDPVTGEPTAFNPFKFFDGWSPAVLYGFIVLRILSAVVVVPIMEELFWRDYLWRYILAPNDFKLARVGEWAWAPFLIVSGVFATVHGNWWLTAIVWAMMIGALLVYTKSIGACIIAHGVTNLLLAVYVLVWKDWSFW